MSAQLEVRPVIDCELRPLAVHVVFQEFNSEAANTTRALATEIHARLARGPRPPGIPVNLWCGMVDPSGRLITPCQPPLENAVRNVVILLIDQPFFDSRKGWKSYLNTLASILDGQRDLLLPVSIAGSAHRVADALSDINCIPVKDPQHVDREEAVFHAILTAILGLLPDAQLDERMSVPAAAEQMETAPSPRVFICHAKSDGDKLARSLRRFIYERTQLTCFFDTHDIPHGSSVRNSIRRYIAESCLLVVWTDSFHESRWCQAEVSEARERQRPILVLDALRSNSPRVLPQFVNMPVIRWRNDPASVISALLLELVRTRHTRALFKYLAGREALDIAFMPYPPHRAEASSLLGPSNSDTANTPTSGVVIYPDPPLPAEELDAFHEAFPALKLHSLSEWAAFRAAGKLSVSGASTRRRHQSFVLPLAIGISVSEAEDWPDLGLTAEHQDDLLVHMARQIIVLGGRILWGGDLRRKGIGERLQALVRAYHQSGRAPQDHIACYLAWPSYREASANDLESNRTIADLICLPKPLCDVNDDTASDAICYSALRRQMTKDSQARIVLGGRMKGYAGRYPGIAEEALEAIKRKLPLYIIGGFGGAARAVFDAITQPEVENALVAAWAVHSNQNGVPEMHHRYDQLAMSLERDLIDLRVDHEEMLKCFGDLALAGLSNLNGLTPDENKKLASSQDIHEITALLVKGLSRIHS
ncbi:TIR domain-containing protein [Azospirillum palustre]